jgi:hypothetical protein
LNLRPSGYEPDELPDCSTPRQIVCLTTQTPHRSQSTCVNLNPRLRSNQSTRLFSEVRNYARAFLTVQAQTPKKHPQRCSVSRRHTALTRIQARTEVALNFLLRKHSNFQPPDLLQPPTQNTASHAVALLPRAIERTQHFVETISN